MKTSSKIVSVIIPCYNAELYIEKCLISLLNQTYDKLEVIIVNDGSTDNCADIINDYIKKFEEKSKKLILLEQKNKGQAAAINNALQKVSGEYLMWHDADDWLEYDAVESLVKCLEDKKLNFIRAEAVVRNQSNLDLVVKHLKSKDKKDKNIFNDYIFERDAYCFCGIFMVKTACIDKYIKDRRIYESRAGQNWQLILPISYFEKCGYLDKIIYNYRVLENSHSHSVKKYNDLISRCNDHKDILKNVINSIDMIEKDKKKYDLLIDIKYIIKKTNIFINCAKHKILKMFRGKK